MKCQRVYKPGSVLLAKGPSFIWDDSYLTPLATDPDDSVETRHAPSLFGLALDGVYLAASVTIRAVRSYRTLSP